MDEYYEERSVRNLGLRSPGSRKGRRRGSGSSVGARDPDIDDYAAESAINNGDSPSASKNRNKIRQIGSLVIGVFEKVGGGMKFGEKLVNSQSQ